MFSIRHKSRLARTAPIAIGALIAVLGVLAVRPMAGLAAPPVEPGPPQLTIEPGNYDFGIQPLNWGSRETNFQLRNTGAEGFQVGSPEIAGPGAEAFWTGYSPCYGSYLNPGESCSVQVYFGPHNAVEYVAQFRVSVDSYSFSAGLTGTGGRAAFSPASNPTDFGAVKVGSAGVTREIQVTNTGNIAGGAFIAVIAGGAIGSFQILDENCTGIELAPAATCTLQVRFQPVSEGVKKAMLGLFGDSDGGTQIVLTGVGTATEPATSSPSSAASPAVAGPAPEVAAQPRKKPRKYKPRSRRRQGRVAIHIARRISAETAGRGRRGR